jgi:hypothetical protein
MPSNTVYLLRKFGPALAILVFMSVCAAIQIARGDRTTIPLIVVAICLFAFVFGRARKKADTLYQEHDLDVLLNKYHSMKFSGSDGVALRAHLCAYAATLYGNFPRAWVELSQVEWSDLPPLIQALGRYNEALLALFEAKDLPLAEKFLRACLKTTHSVSAVCVRS